MTTALPAPVAATVGLTLTDTERHEVEALARLLSGTAPGLVDESRWREAARALACRLPLRIREEIRHYRHDPGPDGLLVLRNLPMDEAWLPETPAVAGSVERQATLPASVVALISHELGEVTAYQAEKSGALVQNVVPIPGMEGSQSNAGSTLLELHVENAFHPHRPDFVGLFCLREHHDGDAGTFVASIRRAVALLPEAVRRALEAPRFVTQPPPSFQSGEAPCHPVLGGDRQDPNVQVDFHATAALDPEAADALESLRTAFLEVAALLMLRPGELAFVDNRVAVHGRTSFRPRYDGRDRWLHRTFVHLDNRRSAGYRPGGGAILL
ncbi:TauD/TfdA family dioxygenase [Streptomyces sp. NBC_00102]|uniref:TauD/TfdA family dioxygenase n=1 Tax=Streptomyces sp. NBC_00102 TaxID=2975652 RepID=UPI00225009DB|nr:TauD/TfdA family dioxygenase [Streptomyces sp. NBC_00102]MCX5400284.1 TauD/TfdA family dioxygenase [Streptomyces sp. NBC_00102]